MYFGLPDEAIALRDGLREVLASACTPATIRAAWDGDPCEALWKTLGEYGVLGLLVDEERGGLGLDELSFVAAMEECGYAGVPGPLVETVAYLRQHPDLPLDGSARIAVSRKGSEHTPYAGVATHVQREHELLTTFEVQEVASVDRSRRVGIVTADPAADRSGQISIVSHNDYLEQFGPPRPGWALAPLGTAAFLLGLARRQLDMTVAYLKTRQQFGVQIGSFQGLKHPLAEAVVGTEFAWPVVMMAAYASAQGDTEAGWRISHAKAAASEASYRMSRVCLQAHGAIGYTTEYDLHLFAKRTWAMSKDWGSASDHRYRVARSQGIGGYS